MRGIPPSLISHYPIPLSLFSLYTIEGGLKAGVERASIEDERQGLIMAMAMLQILPPLGARSEVAPSAVSQVAFSLLCPHHTR